MCSRFDDCLPVTCGAGSWVTVCSGVWRACGIAAEPVQPWGQSVARGRQAWLCLAVTPQDLHSRYRIWWQALCWAPGDCGWRGPPDVLASPWDLRWDLAADVPSAGCSNGQCILGYPGGSQSGISVARKRWRFETGDLRNEVKLRQGLGTRGHSPVPWSLQREHGPASRWSGTLTSRLWKQVSCLKPRMQCCVTAAPGHGTGLTWQGL